MTFAVCLMLFAAAPDAGVARDAGVLPLSLPPLPFVWELPPKTMHEVPIDGTTYVSGVPVRLRYVMVKDSAEEIGKHFLASFKRQGLFVDKDQRVDRMLTGVDPQSIYTYSVVLQPNAEGYTTVILGEAQPLQMKKPTPGGLPIPPSARDVVPVQFEGYTLLSFKVKDPLASIKSFYAVELPRHGYVPKNETDWWKAGEQLELTVRPDEGKTHVVLKHRRLAPQP